ncbi:MAG: hypothetical protein JWN98_1672 [Abditibacteriota bacterium]|nr:hypothetical protein [Abditibacteriota bacterium]
MPRLWENVTSAKNFSEISHVSKYFGRAVSFGYTATDLTPAEKDSSVRSFSNSRSSLIWVGALSLSFNLGAPLWAQDNAVAPPREALITAVRGAEITVGIGAQEGAVPGAVYGIAREGRIRARVQLTQVRPTDSLATVLNAEDEFVLAVGDTAQFIGVQDLPTNTPTQPQPVQPQPVQPQPEPEPAQPIPPAQPQPAQSQATTPVSSGAVLSTVTANVTAIQDGVVTINAGTNQGARTGQKVPILRGGDIIAIARLQIVSDNSSQGELIWRDETSGLVAAGDTASFSASTSVPLAPGTAPVTIVQAPGQSLSQPVPSAPIAWETGASNAVVPRADETYPYLAALAASKLITRYPAHLFHDEGVRQHRTEEDITFTRAQIAGLIREALQAADERGDTQLSGKERAALASLIDEYETELKQLGVEQSTLQGLQANRGFAFGISGQSRASLVGGNAQNGGNEPFSERQGGRRTRSGFDTRTNIFGVAGENLKFFAQIDAGTESRRGAGDSGFNINRALLDFNAKKMVRGLSFKVGRDELWWGPGHFGTLLLSDVSGPMNMIQSTFARGSYKLQGLYAPLDRGPLGGSRSLYGHNLQVQVGKQTRIGIAETLLLPRDRLDPLSLLAAFSPLPLGTLERARKRNTAADNGNALVQAYIETSVAKGVRGWAEFLLDDIGVNQSNLVRNRLGTLMGAHIFSPRDPARLGLFAEYANLQGRTYLGLRAINDSDYYYRNRPIGYPVAPPQGAGLGGAESLRFEAYWRALPRLRLSGGVELADLASEQNNLSRQQVYRFRAAYDLSRTLTLVARAQRVATARPNFILGEPGVTQRLFQMEIAQAF